MVPRIRFDSAWLYVGVSRCRVGTGVGRREMTMFSSTMMLLPTMMLMLMVVDVEGKELERFSRKGKVVSQEEDGNISVELRRKRWEERLHFWWKPHILQPNHCSAFWNCHISLFQRDA